MNPAEASTSRIVIANPRIVRRRAFRLVALAAAAAVLLAPPIARAESRTFTPQRILPVDEAARDPSFLEFRGRLRAAIQRRDAKFLLGIVDPGIKLSFGGDEGLDQFKKLWKPERPDSAIWCELDAVLRLGGTFGYDQDSSHTFWAPYVFGRFRSDGGFDVFVGLVVIGSDVRMRSGPSTGAPVIATLSHEVVEVVMEEPKAGANPRWMHVTTAAGRTGYVWREYLRSPIDYRAAFQQKGGRWKLDFFVAGD